VRKKGEKKLRWALEGEKKRTLPSDRESMATPSRCHTQGGEESLHEFEGKGKKDPTDSFYGWCSYL